MMQQLTDEAQIIGKTVSRIEYPMLAQYGMVVFFDDDTYVVFEAKRYYDDLEIDLSDSALGTYVLNKLGIIDDAEMARRDAEEKARREQESRERELKEVRRLMVKYGIKKGSESDG
jgi:hypothetical protein